MTSVAHSAASIDAGRIPERMTAAALVRPGTIEMVEVDVPEPGPGEVLIALEGSGVCASNLPAWGGRPWFEYPFTSGALGHEGWGRIARLGSGVDRFEVGDRVAFLSDHAYAEFDAAPAAHAVRLPRELEGRPFPGEPLGCAMNIFERSGIRAGETVAIVGIGFLGALLTRLATRAGATVIAVSRRDYALDVARSWGAAHAIEMDDHQRVIERVRGLTGGRLCDRVVEAVGSQWPLDLAGELTRERGTLIIAGYHQDGPRQVNMQLWNWRGLDVVNAHERDPAVYVRGIEAAVDAVMRGLIDPDPLYREFPLHRLADALDAVRDRPDGFMKALVTI